MRRPGGPRTPVVVTVWWSDGFSSSNEPTRGRRVRVWAWRDGPPAGAARRGVSMIRDSFRSTRMQ